MTNYHQYILDYLDQLLSDEERLAFEAAMTEDPDLKAEVNRQKMIQDSLQHQADVAEGADQLSHTLLQKRHLFTKAEPQQKTPKIRSLNYRRIGLAIAASVAFILIISSLFTKPNFDKLPAMPNQSMRGDHTNQLYTNARQYYKAKDYTKAITTLQQLQQQQPQTALYSYYLGLSYIGKGDYTKALPLLQKIAEGPSVYHLDAQYFLGLSYYKLNQPKQAQIALKKVDAQSQYYQMAQKLLDKLS